MRHLLLRSLLFLPVLVLIAFAPGAVPTVLGAACGDGVGPCSCGDTVVTNTKLKASDPVLTTRCTCHGLIVDPAVTLLEIRGTLRGSGPVAGSNVCSGILVPFSTGVVVRIGTIENFPFGVRTGDFAGALVSGSQFSRLRITDSLVGILVGGDDNVIEINTITNNDQVGISLNGFRNGVSRNRLEDTGLGMEVSGGHNIVSQNVGLHNRGGCVLLFGDDSTVELNRCAYNAFGFVFVFANNNTVTRNTAEHNNSGEGFAWVVAESNTISLNRSNNNAFGFSDETSGDGTGGTANFYTRNQCANNGFSNSQPPGLCF